MKPFPTLLFALIFAVSQAQTGVSVPQMSACDNLVTNFMNTHNIPGLSFALTKDGKLVYHRAFGEVDAAGTQTAYPYHIFRLASLSKPITAVAIMKMYEDGLLSMNDKVFGTGGILENHPYLSGATITDVRIYDITVQQLLEHSAGWNRGLNCFPNPTTPYPWFFSGCDPIVAPLHVAQENGAANPASDEDMIYFLLEKGLDFTPGTQYQYSNIGYLVLGEVIEELSGMDYETYLKTEIFDPIGAYDLHLGKNLLADKIEREAEYIGNGYTTLDCYGNGTYVPWEYGGFNLEAMGAHGGWIAGSRDLARMLVAVDGFATKPDILTAPTISLMTAPSANNSFYAKGWAVNFANNWWHTGSLDGTATFLARSANGYTWAILLNKRVIGAGANSFWSDLDNLPWNCIAATSTYPAHDLFLTPDTNATDLVFSHLSNESADLAWVNGNGSKRLIVAKEGSPVDRYPVDGTNYMAGSTFGTGSDLGNGNFVIFDGNAAAMTLDGLTDGATYYFRIFEYNQNASTGNHKLYLLSHSPPYVYYSGCVTSVTLPAVFQNYYQAAASIDSEAALPAFDVTFQAEQEITLHPGFSAQAGHIFEIIMTACN